VIDIGIARNKNKITGFPPTSLHIPAAYRQKILKIRLLNRNFPGLPELAFLNEKPGT
jgi:hypothetical protein